MTLMITTASAGAPGAPTGTTETTGSDGETADAFAGVLAGIPESDSHPSGRTAATDRTSTDRTSKQAEESDAELAAMAGMALLVPAGPAAAALALQATRGLGSGTEPGTDDSGEPAAAVSAAAPEGTAAATTFAPPSRPSEQPAAVIGQLPDSGAESGTSASVAIPVPAQEPSAGQGQKNRSDRGNSEAAGSGRQAGAGHGVGPAKAMGPANAADPAQATAAARLFSGSGTTEPPAAAATSNRPQPAEFTLPSSGAAPEAGKLAGSATLPGSGNSAGSAIFPGGGTLPDSATPPRSAAGARVISHRPEKFSVSAADARAAEPVPPTGPLATAVPTGGPASAAAQPAMTAVQQAPAQPLHVGQQVAGPGGHHADRASFQPSSMAETPLARQVAAPLLALRAGGDGSHQLIVALHPAELGPVNVHVRIEGDLMTIQLASNNEIAHDTLRDALPQLRSELQSAGLGGVALSLDLASGGAPGSGAFPDPRQAGGDPGRSSRPAPIPELTPAVPRHRTGGNRIGTSSSSGLDRWL